MHHRMKNWSSHGFIQILGQKVTEVVVLDSYKRYNQNQPHRQDSFLGEVLLNMSDDDIQKVMEHYPHAGSRVLRLTKLRAAFRDVLRTKLEGAITYNKDTCIEFHQFLVALLFGYWKSLTVFRSLMNTPVVKKKKKKKKTTTRNSMDVAAD
jgi:hypothetical protein